MKKIVSFIFAIILSLNVLGQSPLNQAVDFTATDCHGTEVNLFNILDGGQYVLIDFFFTSCTPCQQAVPKIVESCTTFGCNMHDVYYIEISDRDSDVACQSWAENYDVFYPTISGEAGGNTICNQYQIGGFPTVILIAPDHSVLIHDLYPIPDTQTVITALENNGIEQHECTPASSEIIPDFTGTDINGDEIHLFEILDAGQFVLINFFLTGDSFSENIMKDMVDAYNLYGCNDHDVFFMEISPNGNNSSCQTWVQNFNVGYPTISREGGGNDIAQSIPVGFYPTIMLIRPDHTIAQRDIYPPTLEFMVMYMEAEGIQQYECNDDVDENIAENVMLYPNPADNFLRIDGDVFNNILIFNALGQKVEEIYIDGNALNINTSSYENGVYFVKVGEKAFRFVVAH